MLSFDTFEIEAIKSTDYLLSEHQVGVVHSMECSLVYLVSEKDSCRFFNKYTSWISQMSSWIGVFYEWADRKRFIGFWLNDNAKQPEVTPPNVG